MGKPKPFAVATHPGKVRGRNEDFVAPPPLDAAVVAEKGLLFIVADGVGGASDGDVASRMVVESIQRAFVADAGTNVSDLLRAAIKQANLEVFREGQRRGKRMASTVTAAVLRPGHQLVVANVGDSRAYAWQGGSLHQLTTDHTELQEAVDRRQLTPDQAREMPRSGAITRAMGADAYVVEDVTVHTVEKGARLLLCTDGLYGEVADDHIAAVLRRERGDPDAMARRLIDMANADKNTGQGLKRGGSDNITLAIADVDACVGLIGKAEKEARKAGGVNVRPAPQLRPVPPKKRVPGPDEGVQVAAGVPITTPDAGQADTIGRSTPRGPQLTPRLPTGPSTQVAETIGVSDGIAGPAGGASQPPVEVESRGKAEPPRGKRKRRLSAPVAAVAMAAALVVAVGLYAGVWRPGGLVAEGGLKAAGSVAEEAGTAAPSTPAGTEHAMDDKATSTASPTQIATDTPPAVITVAPTSAPTRDTLTAALSPAPATVTPSSPQFVLRPVTGPSECRVTLDWSPNDVDVNVLVCYGDGCNPTLGIYGPGKGPIRWEPAKALPNRNDLKGQKGEYGWRVFPNTEAASRVQPSEVGRFTWDWKGGECSSNGSGESNTGTGNPTR